MEGLPPSDLGINSALIPNVAPMRGRVRSLRRSNPVVGKIHRAAVADIIGTGPTPRPKPENAALRRPIKRVWERWCRETNFYAKLVTGVSCWWIAGEFLSRFRGRKPTDGLQVPLQLQMLSPDHLPLDKTEPYGGNRIIAGVEFTPIDDVAAYWLYREHPGELFATGRFPGTPERIEARDILHVFEALEPGQVRGEPPFAGGIVRAHALDVHDFAQLERQKVGALYSGWFEENEEGRPRMPPGAKEGEDEEGLDDDEADEDGALDVTWRAGQIGWAPSGFKFTQTTPPQLTNEYEAFQKTHHRALAGCGRVTYEQATGDYQGATYSSVRSGEMTQHRQCEQLLWTTLLPWCHAVYQRVIREAVFAGVLPIRPSEYMADPAAFTDARWIPDGWPWVDPESEANAWVTLLDANLESRQGIAAVRGVDIEDLHDEQVEDLKRQIELAELQQKLAELRGEAMPRGRRTAAERQASEARRG